MRTDTKALVEAIKRRGVMQKWLCGQLGISQRAWYDKLHGKSHFWLREAQQMITLLHLTPAEQRKIFGMTTT